MLDDANRDKLIKAVFLRLLMTLRIRFRSVVAIEADIERNLLVSLKLHVEPLGYVYLHIERVQAAHHRLLEVRLPVVSIPNERRPVGRQDRNFCCLIVDSSKKYRL